MSVILTSYKSKTVQFLMTFSFPWKKYDCFKPSSHQWCYAIGTSCHSRRHFHHSSPTVN